MAKYTQTDADNMVDNTNQSPGLGWLEKETFCSGCEDVDDDGNPVIIGRGWRYDMWNKQGRPVEIRIDLPENESEMTRKTAAKNKIITMDIVDCDVYPPTT